MKKSIQIVLVALVLFLSSTFLGAQTYKSAVGLRLGYPISVSYKTFIGETNALEVSGSYRKKTYSIYGYKYGWTLFGLGASYQIHNDLEIGSIDGLQWYYGGGASVYFYKYFDDDNYYDDDYFDDYSSTSIGIQAYLGLDYKFANYPINMSVDWVPTYLIGGYDGGFGADYGALSIRYILDK